MHNRHHHNSNLAFNDLLFNVLVGFVFLFVIAFILMNPVAKQGDILTKAEFVIQLNWGDERFEDIDLWVQRDDNVPVSYRDKRSSVMHLERDDLGTKNDTVVINGGEKIIKQNTEVITVRGIVPGDYYVGVHYYSNMNGYKKYNKVPDTDEIEVEVVITKINPYSVVYKTKVMLYKEGDKANIIGFTIDQNGDVSDRFSHTRNLGPDVNYREINEQLNRRPSLNRPS